jgi:hypothetical protein
MENVPSLTLLLSILRDITAWRGDLGKDVAFSSLKMQYLIEEAGDHIYYDHLPRFGKAFDKALSSNGFYDQRFFTDHSFPFAFLLESIFDHNGDLVKDPCINSIFFMRQLCYMFKKVNASCSKDNILAAVRDFHKIEDEMRNYCLNWSDDLIDTNHHLSFSDDLELASNTKLVDHFQKCADIISTSFPELICQDLSPRHGPGAVSDKKTGTDKYSFPYWPNKLQACFPYDAFASHCLLQNTTGNISFLNHEHPAKLIAVPKTPMKPRLIASEPSYHQYCQQAVLLWFRERLPWTLQRSISFRSQEPSRQMALESSLRGDTISMDLSSASDRLSCWTIERFFRRNPSIIMALHSIRSRYLIDTISSPPSYRMLKKYANQGSAVTFPLQSIIYATACISALLFEEGKSPSVANIGRAAKRVRIFGDDLIVPKKSHISTMRILNHIGFKINMGKTHIDGWFRESCGMDAYRGYNVTPVYVNNLRIERSGESLSSFVEMSNNAYKAGLFHLSACLRRVVLNNFKDAHIPVSKRNDLPCVAFSSFTSEYFEECKYDKHLQQLKSRCYTVGTRQTRGGRSSDSNLLQYFVEDPSPDSFWTHGFVIRNSTRLKVGWVLIAR